MHHSKLNRPTILLGGVVLVNCQLGEEQMKANLGLLWF